MSKKPFARIKNAAPAPAPAPTEFQIKVSQRRHLLLQEQVANLSVQASQILAERDILAEENQALRAQLAKATPA